MGHLKHEMAYEKEGHASTQAKYAVLLMRANKLEHEAMDKEDKLTKAIAKLKENSRCFFKLKEAQRKVEGKIKEAQKKI